MSGPVVTARLQACPRQVKWRRRVERVYGGGEAFEALHDVARGCVAVGPKGDCPILGVEGK